MDLLPQDSLYEVNKLLRGNGNPSTGILWRLAKVESDMYGDDKTEGIVETVEELRDLVKTFRVGLSMFKFIVGFLGVTSLTGIITLLKIFGVF